jgi:hypothetical protein
MYDEDNHPPTHRFPNLTSEETIERGAEAAYHKFYGDEVPYIMLDDPFWKGLAEAVLRAAQESPQ